MTRRLSVFASLHWRTALHVAARPDRRHRRATIPRIDRRNFGRRRLPGDRDRTAPMPPPPSPRRTRPRSCSRMRRPPPMTGSPAGSPARSPARLRSCRWSPARDAQAAPAYRESLAMTQGSDPQAVAARIASALRVRSLHAALLRRAETAKADGQRMPQVPRKRSARRRHRDPRRPRPLLSAALGRARRSAGLIGVLTIEIAARYLKSRDTDGLVIGDGFDPRNVEAMLTVMSRGYALSRSAGRRARTKAQHRSEAPAAYRIRQRRSRA